MGAQAYLQLSLENPLHYRRINVARLDNIIASGGQLENYFQRILFTGTGADRRVNTNLFEALLDYYADKLETFTSGVRARENAYAATHAMPAYESWRRWDVSVPRQYLSSTRVERLPLNLTRVARIAAGREHAIALLKDGTVIGWGNNDYGQVTVPPDATNVLAIAASHAVSMILKSDGTVRVFGSTAHGVTEVPTDLSNVVAIATSGIHCVVAKADGSVVAWGYNGHGNCDVPPGLTDVVAVTAADEQRDSTSSLALKSDGTVVGWGSVPAPIPTGLDDVIAIAAGDQHYLALKADGRVAAWGWGEQTNVPPTLSNVVAIAAGEYGNLALLADGTLETWGASLRWPGPNVTNVSAIAIGGGEGYAVQNDGPVINLPQTSRTAAVPDLSDAIAIASGEWHNLALRSNGTVVGWGAGSFLSDPYDIYNQGQAMTPAQATNIVEIATGARHSLALKSDGTVLAWGENRSHQTNTPGIATNVVALGAGGSHNLALRADGTVVGWGKNDLGQATGVRNSVSPNLSTGIVTIAGQPLTNVAMIVAGHDHSLAIRADGTVVGWGDNRSGQVTGVPTGTPPTGAVVVGPAGTNVVAIAAGSVHSMALRGDGTVVAWGRNEDGQTSCPASATNVLAISAGYFHSLALRADGTVIGWGKNDYGQSTGQIHGSPGTVFLGDKPLTNILAMSAGGDFSCFLGAASSTGGEKLVIAQRQLPVRVAWQLAEMSEDVLGELSLDLHAFGVDELSGAKALLRAILDLGLPYTMERNDVLHGFLYGSESLGDSEIARDLSLREIHRLRFEPSASPEFLRHVLPIRFARFAERLRMRLNEAAEGGQPEQPRLVGHTQRLLSLLRDAHIAQMPFPAPALEIKGGNGRVALMLFGEPYARYTLLQRANLTGPGWESMGITNLVNEGISELPSLDPRHFYRAVLPAP